MPVGERTVRSPAEAFGPSIAILDVGLPSLDGLELARRLRASDSTRSLSFSSCACCDASARRTPPC